MIACLVGPGRGRCDACDERRRCILHRGCCRILMLVASGPAPRGPGPWNCRLRMVRFRASVRSCDRSSASDRHPVKSHRRPVPSGVGLRSEDLRPSPGGSETGWIRLPTGVPRDASSSDHLPRALVRPASRLFLCCVRFDPSGQRRRATHCNCGSPGPSEDLRGVFSVTAAGIAAAIVRLKNFLLFPAVKPS